MTETTAREPIYHIYQDMRDIGSEVWTARFQALRERYQSLPDASATLTDDVIVLTTDAIYRHIHKYQENFDKLELSTTDRERFLETVGRVSHIGESVLWLGMKAVDVLAPKAGPKHNKVTLEVLGRTLFGECEDPELEVAHNAFAEQSKLYGSDVQFISMSEGEALNPRFYFFPHYDNPYSGDFSYNKGRLQIRTPIADMIIRNGPKLNIFSQREVMISLDRTDEFTGGILSRIGDRAWGRHPTPDYIRADAEASQVAGQAYERFCASDNPEIVDIFPTRDQVLATAWYPDKEPPSSRG